MKYISTELKFTNAMLLMLFHICEPIGFANPSIFLCECQKDFGISAVHMHMQSLVKSLMNCSAQLTTK